MLTGYKTYIVGIAGLVYAGIGFWMGWLTGEQAMQFIQISLTGMGLRAAL